MKMLAEGEFLYTQCQGFLPKFALTLEDDDLNFSEENM